MCLSLCGVCACVCVRMGVCALCSIVTKGVNMFSVCHEGICLCRTLGDLLAC